MYTIKFSCGFSLKEKLNYNLAVQKCKEIRQTGFTCWLIPVKQGVYCR